MNVTGLSQDLYLVNNPIWIEINELSEGTRFVEITVQNTTESAQPSQPIRVFRMGNTIRYNLQELIKGNFPTPRHPQNPANETPIGTNYARFTITVSERVGQADTTTGDRTGRSTRGRGYEREQIAAVTTGQVATIAKTFIRGGKKTLLANQTLKTLEELRTTQKIPRWGSYPIARYYLGSDKQIYFVSIVPDAMTKPKILSGCDPLYIRFLNRKGGYSFWLFESFEESTANQSGETLGFGADTRHTGIAGETTVTAETKVTREFFPLMEDLHQSPEIHLYEKYGLRWAPVTIKGNTWKENSYENVQPVSVSFAVQTTLSPSVTW